MNYIEKLQKSVSDGIGLCVGLDPVIDRIPEKFHKSRSPLLDFNLEIIHATSDIASAYKPNLAFYEVYGANGWQQLEETIKAIPDDVVVIADAKRGDIGNTSKAYARALFEGLKADAATINPYLGSDSIGPFIEDDRHGVFVLAVTSNPGSAELQALLVDDEPLSYHVVRMCRKLNKFSNVGLVMGATRPEMWAGLLETSQDMPLLIPGIGAQGGDLNAVKAALKSYKAPVLINSSRSILFASSGDDFAEAARVEALRTKEMLIG